MRMATPWVVGAHRPYRRRRARQVSALCLRVSGGARPRRTAERRLSATHRVERPAQLQTRCALHTYVLMDIHVHLLPTPPNAHATGQLKQRLGRSDVALFNGRYGAYRQLFLGSGLQSLSGGQQRYLLRLY